MKPRTLSAVIASITIGVALPTILYFTKEVGVEIDHFGSCLVNPEFRFKCGIDQEKDTLDSLSNCSDALGCWEDLPNLQFKCFHSVPSAFQYYLDGPAVKDTDDSISFNIRPGRNLDDDILKMKSKISWHSKDVLNIQFSSQDIDFKSPIDEGETSKPDVIDGTKEFNISYSDESREFFFVNIGRIDSNSQFETIFDTRLSPLAFYENKMIFGTALPSKYFYGIKGGQGTTVLGATVVDGVTTFGQNELPFYMVREKSGKMHGMLLETTKPFVAQVIDGPGIMFHLEGEISIPFSLKFFVGPTQKDVLQQFSSYMTTKTKQSSYRPPYWGLGVHLCRQSKNDKETLADLEHLNRENADDPGTLPGIPYDSDCISENLRPLFKIDAGNFPESSLKTIISKIRSKSRYILPAQKLIVPNKAIVSTEPLEMFIADSKMKSRFIGYQKTSAAINYFSIFNQQAKTFIQKEFKAIDPLLSAFDFKGIALVDNLPRHENASWISVKNNKISSRIQSNFDSEIWGTVHPDAMHLNVSGFDTEVNLTHLELSNSYGHESLKLFNTISKDYEKTERTIVTTTSMWTESFLYGAYSGIDVPFTWEGLRDSLSNLLRFFMFAPYGGIPVCGSYVTELRSDNSTDEDLCLRWFQVALFLPFVRNTYGGPNKKISRGPLDFNRVYQKHLTRNIQERYAYNPYYYTLFKEYTDTGIPPVVPVSFYFQSTTKMASETFPILDQFMIGPALLAAPLVFVGTARPVYFPPGLWYNMDGEISWQHATSGGTATVSALINYVPLFLRDGHILPTLHNPIGSTAEESRAGDYTIIATYPRSEVRSSPSVGSLYLDDGVSVNVLPSESDLVLFELSQTEFLINATSCNLNLATHKISTTVNEVRLFGFPKKPRAVKCSIPDFVVENRMVVYDGETKVLRLKFLKLDWCKHPVVRLSWESPY